MKNLRTLARTAKKSLTRNIQEKEERISDSEETIKKNMHWSTKCYVKKKF